MHRAGAQGRTRTDTISRLQAPKACVSTNFTTWATLESTNSAALAAAHYNQETTAHIGSRAKNGGPSGTRTPDQVVKSHLLYQLS